MSTYVDLMKWVPAGLQVINVVGKLYDAVRVKFEKNKAGTIDTADENKAIDKHTLKLEEIGHGLLPKDIQEKAEIHEIDRFKDAIIAIVKAIQEGIDAFLALLK